MFNILLWLFNIDLKFEQMKLRIIFCSIIQFWVFVLTPYAISPNTYWFRSDKIQLFKLPSFTNPLNSFASESTYVPNELVVWDYFVLYPFFICLKVYKPNISEIRVSNVTTILAHKSILEWPGNLLIWRQTFVIYIVLLIHSNTALRAKCLDDNVYYVASVFIFLNTDSSCSMFLII